MIRIYISERNRHCDLLNNEFVMHIFWYFRAFDIFLMAQSLIIHIIEISNKLYSNIYGIFIFVKYCDVTKSIQISLMFWKNEHISFVLFYSLEMF